MAIKWNVSNDLSSDYYGGVLAPRTRTYFDMPQDVSSPAILPSLEDSVRRAGNAVRTTVSEPQSLPEKPPQKQRPRLFFFPLGDRRHIYLAGD